MWWLMELCIYLVGILTGFAWSWRLLIIREHEFKALHTVWMRDRRKLIVCEDELALFRMRQINPFFAPGTSQAQ